MLFRNIAAVLLGGLGTGVTAAAVEPSRRQVPGTGKHVLHERSMPHWGSTWAKRQPMPADAVLPMRIGLKQRNLDHGHNLLMDISNPSSPNFGKHLSSDEVVDMFAPEESSAKAVMDWVVSAGIDASRVSQSANKQWIQFDASAEEAGNLLVTEYYIYQHHQTGTQNIACEEYHVPADVQEHVDYVTPGTRLRLHPSTVNELKRSHRDQVIEKRGLKAMYTGLSPIAREGVDGLPPLNLTNCDEFVTPQCVKRQYGVPDGSKASPGNELGVFESLNDHYSKADLDAYFNNIYPRIPSGTYPTEELIDGAIGASQSPTETGGESDLDFQAAYPIIWPQQAILFQTDDQYYEINMTQQKTPYVGFWNTFYDALDGSYCTSTAYGETGDCDKDECLDPSYPDLNPGGYNGSLQCGVYKPTNVISISYGGGEADVPAYYMKRQCDEIMKLVLQGVTVVISAGDSGVGSFPGDGGWETGCAGEDGNVFFPSFAATCPYVLAVGSTELDKPKSNCSSPSRPLPERSTARFPSGGGFSNYFPVADYQKDAVATYFQRVNLSFTGYSNMGNNFSDVGNGVYNTGGRGYPDVSAIGDNYVVRFNDTWSSIGGTSLSAPIWASLLTLVNEERIAAGKKTVGFVNPTLYAHPEVFNDITTGSNPACNSTGFLAAKGWDPVSGLGTPKYPKLLDLLLNLP